MITVLLYYAFSVKKMLKLMMLMMMKKYHDVGEVGDNAPDADDGRYVAVNVGKSPTELL